MNTIIKAHKYGAKKTEIDGHVFDSKAESTRYGELKLKEQMGIIRELKLQPEFKISEPFVRGKKKYSSIIYRADFAYKKDGHSIVEDVKGCQTEAYKIKRKLFLSQYPNIVFVEITKTGEVIYA